MLTNDNIASFYHNLKDANRFKGLLPLTWHVDGNQAEKENVGRI